MKNTKNLHAALQELIEATDNVLFLEATSGQATRSELLEVLSDFAETAREIVRNTEAD